MSKGLGFAAAAALGFAYLLEARVGNTETLSRTLSAECRLGTSCSVAAPGSFELSAGAIAVGSRVDMLTRVPNASATPELRDPCAGASSCRAEEGWIQGPSGPMWARYVVADGVAVFQGDIAVTRLGTGSTPIGGFIVAPSPSESAIAFDPRPETSWPGGVVPYTTDTTTLSAVMQARVATAVTAWNSSTAIQLVPRVNETDFVTFTSHPDASLCDSPPGRQGGQQLVRLGTDCGAGNVVHEIGHAIGFWHEQARSDRDDYVTIDWDAITAGFDDNFQKYADGEGRDWGPYDYGSIMHYPATAFGVVDPATGKPAVTITPLQPLEPGVVMGQRDALSRWDILGAAARQFPIHGAPEPYDRFGSALATGDFDGDGQRDLAVGVPYEAIGSTAGAGAVNVVYGTDQGLGNAWNQIWHGNIPGMLRRASPGDGFGRSLAAGDFDDDDYDDLAIGVPNGDLQAGALKGAGWVTVLYGSADGLTIQQGKGIWDQSSGDAFGGVADVAEAVDGFGSSLAAADFDGDGTADLAIGVLGEKVGSALAAGAVNVLYGRRGSGLGTQGTYTGPNRIWHQDSRVYSDVAGKAEVGDFFGWSLAVGDFDADGYADLAVGVPAEDIGSVVNAGMVNVLYGSAGGISDIDNRGLDQSEAGIPGEGGAEAGDRFGESLASGDFDGRGGDDLAVGVPRERIGSQISAGMVNVFHGALYVGLQVAGSQGWSQDSPDVAGVAQAVDLFGSSLACGDFDGDGFGDLAVGVPREDIPGTGTTDAGYVNVLYGTSSGLSAARNVGWHQDSAKVAGEVESNDQFGLVLAAGDFGHGGRDDLAIGVPLEGVDGKADAGAVNVLYGLGATETHAAGLGDGQLIWHQNQ